MNSQKQAVRHFKINSPQKTSLGESIKQQNQGRGIELLSLESELLLERVRQGGHSGWFLAEAYMSAYRTDKTFKHSLGELIKLDAEGFRLFHEILHIRHIPGWNDGTLYRLEQEIIAILEDKLS